MVYLKTIRSRYFHSFLQLQTPSNYLKNPPQNPYFFKTSLISLNSHQFCFLSSISSRPFSISAQVLETCSEEKTPKSKKPLSLFFKEAVGISANTEESEVGTETDCENAELKEKLRNLEEKVRSLNKKRNEKGTTLKLHSEKHKEIVPKGNQSLYALFSDKKIKKKVKLEPNDLRNEDPKIKNEVKLEPSDHGNEDPMVHKELSADMQMLAYHLYKGGYLKGANFTDEDKFDLNSFEESYAREYLKFAATAFAKDHQEIAKWLSASDLKKIALFGCPSLGQKSVHAAKNLRRFFKIEEQKVCEKCTLNESCKLANKRSHKDASELRLFDVTRILVMYAMESTPQQLVVPEEIKNCVSRLLKEVINLSKTVSTNQVS